MAFNINDLLGKINENGGLTKTNLFEATITRPGANEPALTYFCESAHLPGLSFQTEDIKPSGYGLSEKRPHGVTFQDIQLTFFADVNKKVYTFFHQWMQSVMNFNKKTSPGATAGGLIYATFAYPKDYYGSLQVTQFHEGNGKVITFDFIDAFPIMIGDVQLDWGQENQLVRLPVTFAYTSWTSNTMDAGSTSPQSEAFNLTEPSKIPRIDNQVNQGNPNLNTNPFSNPGALPNGVR